MLKAGIYDPYLDTLGGGERYCLTVAEILLNQGYAVDLFWSGDPRLVAKARQRFSLDLTHLNVVPDCFNSHPASLLAKISSFVNKFKITRQYNVLFYLSDGSIPFLFSQNNLVHLQVPFHYRLSTFQKLKNVLKLRLINRVVCNSEFTRKFIGRFYGIATHLLYPPVDVDKFSVGPKENIILSVGRFDNIMNSKKQDVLITAFREFQLQSSGSSWRLILAGASLQQPSHNPYLQHLRRLAQNYPIDIVVNPSFEQLKTIYAKSKIYWHAAGYQVNEDINPESTEHFGITPVEAMSAGLVPLLVKRGGLPEIIKHQVEGYLWETIDDLIAQTRILASSPGSLKKMSMAAVKKSRQFSKTNFQTNLLTLLNP